MNKSVLMVCSQFPPVYGGAGAQAALLSRKLSQRGWSVEVVTLDQKGIGSGLHDGFTVRRVLKARAASGIGSRLVTTIGLSIVSSWRILRTRPGFVHVHGAYWWSILPVLVGRACGAETVVKSTRDGEDDAATVFSKHVASVPVGWLYGLSLRKSSAVVVLNAKSKESADQLGLEETVRLLRNGVDIEVYERTMTRRVDARADFGLTDEDRVVLFVGYLVRHKGVADLLSAWRSSGDKNALLWLVGPLSGFYRELDDEIPQAIDDLISDGYRVKVFGHVEGESLPRLYWASDVYVLPSYVEGMPNSLAEAVVAGCSIIATSIPGITDILEPNEAIFMEPGDRVGLETALRRGIADTGWEPGFAAARLDMETVTTTYERLYQAISEPR